MRAYPLVVLSICISICTVAFAQEVSITIAPSAQQYQQISRTISTNDPLFRLPFTNTIISGLTTTIYPQCSATIFCTTFDNENSTASCTQTGQTGMPQTITTPISPRAIHSITFSVSGGDSSCFATTYIDSITWKGGSGTTQKIPISSISPQEPKKIGNFGQLFAGTSTLTLLTNNPGIIAWFTPAGTLGPTGKTTTTNPFDDVLICFNSQHNIDPQGNPTCDYVEEQQCAQRGSDWYLGSCCAEGAYQTCQFYPDKMAICGTNLLQAKKWAALEDIGLITTLTCPNIEFVSNGQTYLSCAQPPVGYPHFQQFQGKTTIAGHDYLCLGNHLLECAGNSPYTPTAKKIGDTANIQGNTLYCNSNSQWVTSLDSDSTACTKAGLSWSGNHCCGELQDPLDTYSDSLANCYHNQPIFSGQFILGDKRITNYQGTFYQCTPQLPIGTTQPGTQLPNSTIPLTNHGPCGQPLLNALSLGTARNLVCLSSGIWSSTDSPTTTTIKQTLWQSTQTNGCCPDDQCFDGTTCRNRGVIYITPAGGYYQCR